MLYLNPTELAVFKYNSHIRPYRFNILIGIGLECNVGRFITKVWLC